MVDLLLISLIICYILDVCGVIEELGIPRVKPLTCSTCMCFWLLLAYIIYYKMFSIPMFAYICLLSAMASNISTLERLVISAVNNFLYIIQKKLKL